MLRPANVLALALLSLAAAGYLSAGSVSQLSLLSQREREGRLSSPADVLRYSLQYNGHIGGQPEESELSGADQWDLVACKSTNLVQLFGHFARDFNRTFHGDQDQLDRQELFASTVKRTILLNRVIQSETFNLSNYPAKPEIRNYHFVGAGGESLWYSDITDCELGLVKYILFNIFYRVDKNELEHAYQIALDNSEFLPLLHHDGFEQLANILLVKLFDRFKGDDKMNQLFQWPLYLKKLAGYAHNRRLMNDLKFVERLPLLAYAYPSYFKDVRFNALAVDRSRDNLRANNEHESFIAANGRKFANRQERNRRLVIFRQRQTLVHLLNDRFRAPVNVSTGELAGADSVELPAPNKNELAGRLTEPRWFGQADQPLNLTQFSDLTDAEFVAFLTNDFSLLEGSQQSAEFIDANFPIRPLDEQFRNELAAELELRRASSLKPEPKQANEQQDFQEANRPARLRKTFVMARKVVDELIEDVGLPIGQVTSAEGDGDAFRTFNNVATFFSKAYAAPNAAGPSEGEWAAERQQRFEQFKLNLGRINAWLLKDGRPKVNDERLQWSLLRLADLSWTELKLTLFKICCLTEANLSQLADKNATIAYLGTNKFLCGKMSADEQPAAPGDTDTSEDARKRERAALELYYYYTMHFNKHPSDPTKFSQKFAIFRQNIDHIRRHSCNRGLTLYHSLRLKRADTLSAIDTLDPRRSYTDDINLDRYLYFSVPKLAKGQTEDPAGESKPDETFAELRRQRARTDTNTRAGISYNREPFLELIQNELDMGLGQRNPDGSFYYMQQVMDEINDVKLHTRRYRDSRAWRIYDLVAQRYRYCMRTVRQIDLPAGHLRQLCKSSGRLADYSMAGSLHSSAGQSYGQLQEDSCAFYWMGLEPWAEGLTGQDQRSVELIQRTTCRTPDWSKFDSQPELGTRP